METLDAYLTELASSDPTPGGGSAACVVGALAASLVAMVARITLASARHAAVRPTAEDLIREADALRGRFLTARELDERAYGEVIAAQASPRGTDEEKAARTARVQAALVGAAEAPLAAASLAETALDLAARAETLGNEHLASDVACARHFARAARAASVENVKINLRYIKDEAVNRALTARLTPFLDATPRV